MDEKRRTVPINGPVPFSYAPPTGKLTSYTAAPFTYTQVTQTRGHAWPSAKRGKSDAGGNFSTSKIDSVALNGEQAPYVLAFGYEYSGREYAVNPRTAISDALGYVSFTSDANLMQKGTTAIANCIPTNPVADAGTFIGELKEGLPKLAGKSLFKSHFKDYRKYGSEYLNYEFGWKPLVSDLQKFGQAYQQSDKIIEQLHKDSGKNVRRHFTFPDVVESYKLTRNGSLASGAAGGSYYANLYYSPAGVGLSVDVTVRTETWFSGCFTYHIDLGNTLRDRLSRQAAEARKLYGVELTPATVWNLAPWSWAVDWEGNIGDVLHNVSRFSQDGLVMRYGYIMQKKTAQVSYTLPWGGRFKASPKTDLRLGITASSRIRRRATPFGFGFDMTALSGRQSAILGALGISRGPRHL